MELWYGISKIIEFIFVKESYKQVLIYYTYETYLWICFLQYVFNEILLYRQNSEPTDYYFFQDNGLDVWQGDYNTAPLGSLRYAKKLEQNIKCSAKWSLNWWRDLCAIILYTFFFTQYESYAIAYLNAPC